MRPKRGYWLAGGCSAAIAASRFFPSPQLVDAATGAPFAGRLEFSWGHSLLTPFASFADTITCNGARQDIAVSLLVLAGFGLFRFFVLGHGPKRWFDRHDILVAFGLYLPVAAGFLAWAVLWPHSPPRLVPDDADLMPVDLHSHSSLSWDGRRSFTPPRNLQWHEEAGFGASFVTDHNAFTPGSSNGEEVSLHDAHVAVVGNARFYDRKNYTDDEAGVVKFLAEVKRSGDGLAILSLPEYWAHYWGAPLDRLAEHASGIEIWTSSPKAMEFPAAKRPEVVALARRRNLFLAGATDNHGYGSCACVWNLVRIPAWRSMSARSREDAALAVLRGGFGASTVVARARVEPPSDEGVLFDGPRAWWLMLRAWTAGQCAAALAWCWGLALAYPRARRRAKW